MSTKKINILKMSKLQGPFTPALSPNPGEMAGVKGSNVLSSIWKP
jgi:hypothetical protein